MWVLVIVEDGGQETTVGTYPTMAEAAKIALEQGDVDIRS